MLIIEISRWNNFQIIKKMPGIFSKLISKKKTVDIKELRAVFDKFKQLLAANNTVLELISQLEDKLSGEYIFDINYLNQISDRLSEEVYRVIYNLNYISKNKYTDLITRQAEIQTELENIINAPSSELDNINTLNYDEISSYFIESVGRKNANLGEIRNFLNIATPDGFAVTTAAYHMFMKHNDLWPNLNKLYKNASAASEGAAYQHDEVIDTLFRKAELPVDLSKAITKNINSLYARNKEKFNLAVRSSAFGEDNEGMSYAGQFDSYLNCAIGKVTKTYIDVIASRFKYNIMLYSGDHFLKESALPMAVGIQQMIPASTAGVIYTLDPSHALDDCMIISACYGLGVSVVSGKVKADYFKVSRHGPFHILDSKIEEKATKYICAKSGSVEAISVENHLKAKACLSEKQIFELVETALLLDRYFKRPLDIEWCFDENGKLYVLQCRPLKLSKESTTIKKNLKTILDSKNIVMRDKGQIAQRGIVAGTVIHFQETDDPASFPAGAIAVSEVASLQLSGIIRRAGAIITDVGSLNSHLAMIAREFGVPLIVNTEDASRLLSTGAEITVDAEENIIYEGIIKELLVYKAGAEDVFRELKEYKILRRLLRKISPLTLLDPKSTAFLPKNCRSYHDILRFSHEKAILELINLNTDSGRFKGIHVKTLELSIPLGLSVLDLGGGLSPEAYNDTIKSVNQICSIPMRAIIEGLTLPGTWSTQPMKFGVGDLISSMTRYSVATPSAEYTGQNLAVISEKYTNLSLRLGYHFNVIDTYVTENINDNYIYFRFVGGVTETERRCLRAILLKEILEKLKFKVTVSGDLVIARLNKMEAASTLEILVQMGRLIGFSRQLDTQMQNQDSVKKYLNKFFEQK